MRSYVRAVLGVSLLLVCVACGSGSSATQLTAVPGAIAVAAPTVITQPVTAQPGNAPTPLAFGETVSGLVTLNDPLCATSDAGVEDGDAGLGLVGPCKTFLLHVPEDGTLVATATWQAKNMYMALETALHGSCCSSPLMLRFRVTAGSTIELGVSIHASDLLPPGTMAPFSLIVALDR